MPTNWQFNLDQIRTATSEIFKRDDYPPYYHALISVEGDVPAEVVDGIAGRVANRGDWGTVWSRRLDLSDGRSHFHYVSINRSVKEPLSAFEVLIDSLRAVRPTLDAMPKSLNVEVDFPAGVERRIQDLLTWVYILHRIGLDERSELFWSTVQFIQSVDEADDAELSPWNRVDCLTDFDRASFLTLAKGDSARLDVVKRRHADRQKRFPQIVTASLSKPLAYVSTLAARLLSTWDDERQAARAVKPKHRRTQSGELPSRAQLLIAFLLQHHFSNDGTVNRTPLTQKEIRDLTGMKQPRISNAFRDLRPIFPNVSHYSGSQLYKWICDSDDIEEHLLRLDQRCLHPRSQQIYRERLTPFLDKIRRKKAEE